jgi:high-affinity nickel-transport protein
MGLIGEKCGPCKEAAEAENGGGLAGSWWRAWGYVSSHWVILDEGADC